MSIWLQPEDLYWYSDRVVIFYVLKRLANNDLFVATTTDDPLQFKNYMRVPLGSGEKETHAPNKKSIIKINLIHQMSSHRDF